MQNSDATSDSTLRNPIRKRSFWRGSIAGVITKEITVLVLLGALYVLRPFVWAAIYGTAYVASKDPISPDSGEWALIQLLAFLSGLAAGAAASRWSKQGTWTAIQALAAAAILLSASSLPETGSLLRTLSWLFLVPTGMALGGWLFMRHEQQIKPA